MLNKIMLIGNLGKDPELNVTPTGTPVARFSLAVNRNTKVGGEAKKETEWFNIVAWQQLAEICEKYLHKGSKVYIEGRIQTRKYTGQDGIQRTAIDVIANDMKMLDSKESSGGTGSYASSTSPSRTSAPPAEDDSYDPFLDADDLP